MAWRPNRRTEATITQLVSNTTNGSTNSEALEEGGVGGLIFAHFHERANDIDAHGDGARAVEDVGSLERTVFGETQGQRPPPAVRKT